MQCLDAGISVVAIAYRYSTDAPAPAPLHDIARALQFARAHAAEWNLDPARVAATGSSAGGAAALWLALHDDLADPLSDDPVARQSTRLTAAVALEAQATYDPRDIRKLFPEFDVTKHPAVPRLIGLADDADLTQLTPEQQALYEESSAYPHASADDPPVLLLYSRPMDTPLTTTSIGIHHPRFGTYLKSRLDELSVPCTLHAGEKGKPSVIAFLREAFGLSEPNR